MLKFPPNSPKTNLNRQFWNFFSNKGTLVFPNVSNDFSDVDQIHEYQESKNNLASSILNPTENRTTGFEQLNKKTNEIGMTCRLDR